MLNPNRVVPNAEDVAAQILDGEAVMINLSSGIYYSMDQVGASIWEQIAAGSNLDAIVDSLTQQYDVSAERAEADLSALVAQMLAENLVRAAAAESAAPASLAPSTNPKLAYQTPKLDIYRDIGHLVALDPPMPGLKDLPWNESASPSSRS